MEIRSEKLHFNKAYSMYEIIIISYHYDTILLEIQNSNPHGLINSSCN